MHTRTRPATCTIMSSSASLSPLSYGHLDDNYLPHAEVRSSLSYGHNEFLDDNDLPHV